MNNTTVIVLVIASVGWILYRQMQVRPVKENAFRIPLILAVIGLAQTVAYISSGGTIGVSNVAAAVLGIIVAVALAYPRARTTKVFPGSDGRYLRQGTPATIVLWIVAIGAHIAIDTGIPALTGDSTGRGLSTATMMLFVAATLFAQSWFLRQRVAAHRDITAAPTTLSAH